MNKAKAALLGLMAISAAAVAANAQEAPSRASDARESTQMHCVSQGGVTKCQIVIDENTGTSEW